MRDSPLRACFTETDFDMGTCGNTQVALRARGGADVDLYLADLSGQRKCLVVGQGAPALLGSRGLPTPAWFAITPAPDGGWVARIGASRFLVSAGAGGTGDEPLHAGRWADDALVLTQDSAEIALGGARAAAVLGEFCALDLPRSARGTWLPTLIAHVEAGLFRPAGGPGDCFHVVCAPADAGALFGVLEEAVRARAGAPIGYADYLSKINSGEVA